MARARNIKPSFFTSEQLADSCPLGRLLFIGLWTLADYKGDLEWKERTIKIQILPWDDCDVKQLAINLDKSGLIRFYSDGIKNYINIPNFIKHQNPHKNEREKGSDIPCYTESMRQVIDLKELVINRDKSGLKPESSHSDRADSLLLIPESPILNPDCGIPESQQVAQQDKPAKKSQLDYSCWPDQPSDQVLTDWLAMRKRLKANVSQTVINRFATELVKARNYGYTVDQCLAECVTRNWRGFEVQWLLNSKQQSGGQNAGQPKSAIERHMQQYYPGRDNPGSGIRDVGGNASVIRGEVVEPVRGGSGRIGTMGIDFERFNEKPN